MVNGFTQPGFKRDTGDNANSYEYLFDINVGTALAPEWLNVPEMTGLAPEHGSKTQDAAVYADQGNDNTRKTGRSFSLAFNMLKKRDATGEFQESWLVLKEAADAIGEGNNLEVRYYDSRGASDCYQGTCSVTRSGRPNTGNADLNWEAWAFASVGEVLSIVNPLKSVAV